jgi:hypothetical protein
MGDVDWHKCRFLESSENLKPLVQKRFGREPSTTVAREIAACLQQGRLFYEAAAKSPLDIRPLQLFYGMVGFSKALVVAHQGRSLSTLTQKHGLKDISAHNSRIAELRIRIGNAGTFQDFNDVVAGLSLLHYTDNYSKPCTVLLPSAKSEQLHDAEMSLQEILSRIPRLESLYKMTFAEEPETAYIGLATDYPNDTKFLVYVGDSELFTDRESLRLIVSRWRAKFPFLRNWRLASAQRAYNRTELKFRNTSNSGIDEFSETYLVNEDGNFESPTPIDEQDAPFPLETGLDPLGERGTYAISPIRGRYISEFSFHYLGLFLLSSLVRYRPQTWMHAISRSALQQAPVDDQALSIIEQFLDLNSSVIPGMVVTVLNPHEDR